MRVTCARAGYIVCTHKLNGKTRLVEVLVRVHKVSPNQPALHVSFKLRLLTIPCTKRGTKPILVQKFLLVSVHGRVRTTNQFSRKAIFERARSQSFVDTKRRRATAFGCPETPFFRPQSTALHPMDLLAGTWCIVPLNGHLATLFPHQVISDDEFHVTKVLKPSLLSIFKSLCINLLTGLRASLLVQHVHFQQSRERQNTWQRGS